MRTQIKANDTVKHIPSGETWVVCGVNYGTGELIPCGYPFPSVAKISDCELIEEGYETKPQSEEMIKALQKHGMVNFIDVRSAMFHGLL